MKTIVRFSDGSSQTYPRGEQSVVISAPSRSNQTFAINKQAWPVQRISVPPTSGTGTVFCDFVETVNGGTGSLGTTSLTISFFGDSPAARCTDGVNAFATYTSEFTLSKP